MADFLVLEEDGTSHILAENGDSLLLEESSPQERSASFSASAAISVAPDPSVNDHPARFHAGEFAAPGGTGNHTVTLPFTETPDFVIFFGANQTGSATGTNLGVYFGMAYRDETNVANLLNHCWFEMPNYTGGNSHRLTSSCLFTRQTPNGAVTMEADIVSFDEGEFTLNFSTVPGDSRPIRYLAVSVKVDGLDGFGHAGGAKFLPTSLDIGFRARSALGLWGQEGSVVDGENDTGPVAGTGSAPTGSIFVGVGAGSYPIGGSGGNRGGGVEQGYQYQNELNIFFSSLSVPNFFRISQRGLIINTITGGNMGAAPSSATALTLPQTVNTSQTFKTLNAWDGESSINVFSTPTTVGGVSSTIDVSVHNPNLTSVGAILWIVGHPTGGSVNGRVPAVGFGVWTPTYEACVFVDGGNGRQALYQSSVNSWCQQANAAGARAGTTTVTDGTDVQIETQEIGGPGGSQQIVMFALGNLEPSVVWVPHIYRRILG